VPVVLIARAADERALEWFGTDAGRAMLVPPITLRALRAAVRATVKECV
jgi:hypothetical protein